MSLGLCAALPFFDLVLCTHVLKEQVCGLTLSPVSCSLQPLPVFADLCDVYTWCGSGAFQYVKMHGQHMGEPPAPVMKLLRVAFTE